MAMNLNLVAEQAASLASNVSTEYYPARDQCDQFVSPFSSPLCSGGFLPKSLPETHLCQRNSKNGGGCRASHRAATQAGQKEYWAAMSKSLQDTSGALSTLLAILAHQETWLGRL